MKTLMYDIEVLPNYTLFAFTGERFEVKGRNSSLTKKQIKKMTKLLYRNHIVTFNGIRYDIPVTKIALAGATAYEMYELSQAIINGDDVNVWRMQLDIKHTDLKEPAPGVGVSLKLYGTRIPSKKLWEFPVDFSSDISKKEMKILKKYCENDLKVTRDLYDAIRPRLDLRDEMSKQYGLDLSSKSDAQIAEAVIVKEVGSSGKIERVPYVNYVAPKFIKFKSKKLKELKKLVEGLTYEINQKNGSPIMPKILSETVIKIGQTEYNVGLGGLHSREKSLVVESDKKNVMRNADVASYYPSIILGLGLFPKQLGSKFLAVYRNIFDTRLKAKAKGDKVIADSLKIVLNGSFGKFGSVYSKLYSPDLLLTVTLTGQLALLMLIEWLEDAKIPVMSANTDGLEYYCPRKKIDKAVKIIAKWEKLTGFNMEHGEYAGLYARDVNNYVAKYDGYVKAKGVYADPDLSKNKQTPIVYEAVRAKILDGTPVEKTIRECKDVAQFTSSRKVNGGAYWALPNPNVKPKEWDVLQTKYGRIIKRMSDEMKKLQGAYAVEHGEYVGSVVRWYYSEYGGTMYYKTTLNMVPMSESVRPMMDLTDELPVDLDYQWYINAANKALGDLGL